jgi:hypothetical protein
MLPNIDFSTIQTNLIDFSPELVVILGIVGLLFLRLFRGFDKVHLGGLALIITLTALFLSVLQALGSPGLAELTKLLGLSGTPTGTTIESLSFSSPPRGGVGPPADGVHRDRDGQPAELRHGRLPQGPPPV